MSNRTRLQKKRAITLKLKAKLSWADGWEDTSCCECDDLILFREHVDPLSRMKLCSAWISNLEAEAEAARIEFNVVGLLTGLQRRPTLTELFKVFARIEIHHWCADGACMWACGNYADIVPGLDDYDPLNEWADLPEGEQVQLLHESGWMAEFNRRQELHRSRSQSAEVLRLRPVNATSTN